MVLMFATANPVLLTAAAKMGVMARSLGASMVITVPDGPPVDRSVNVTLNNICDCLHSSTVDFIIDLMAAPPLKYVLLPI